MKDFEYKIGDSFAHGDMLCICVDSLPEDAVEIQPVNGHLVLTHSETGHNHQVKKDEDTFLYKPSNDDILTGFYVVKGCGTKMLVHNRDHDTHETVALMPPAGDKLDNVTRIYRIKRQRENSPEGWVRARD